MKNVLFNGTLSANWVSDPVDISKDEFVGVHITIKGTNTLVGYFNIQLALDTEENLFWETKPFILADGSTESNIACSSTSNFSAYREMITPAKWARIKYVHTSGAATGNVKIILSEKE